MLFMILISVLRCFLVLIRSSYVFLFQLQDLEFQLRASVALRCPHQITAVLLTIALITQLYAIDGPRPKIGLVLPVFRASDCPYDAC